MSNFIRSIYCSLLAAVSDKYDDRHKEIGNLFMSSQYLCENFVNLWNWQIYPTYFNLICINKYVGYINMSSVYDVPNISFNGKEKVEIYVTMFWNVWTLTKGQLCTNSDNDIWRSMRINQVWLCTSRCIHKDRHICVHRNFIWVNNPSGTHMWYKYGCNSPTIPCKNKMLLEW